MKTSWFGMENDESLVSRVLMLLRRRRRIELALTIPIRLTIQVLIFDVVSDAITWFCGSILDEC